ncbi:MAG: A/G-specific adenine glycosylase [Acidimicrobiia bacterium]
MVVPGPPLTFAGALLGWWVAGGRRDLPWRHTRDPWAVLVSEVMAQQTQVARVAPAWRRFMLRFPTATDCAAAPLADVVTAWAGLGYNRRAVNLHRSAVAVTEHNGGRLPTTLDGLLALPGVGPYTARAVLAFSGQADVGVVDTNSGRVLARAVAGRPLAPSDAQRMADSMVPPGEGWSWNSAVLDLGAAFCTSRSPRCGPCPVASACAWANAGGPDPAPPPARQSRFDGSDRQGRGRLVAVLRAGPVPVADAARAAGWPDDPVRAARAVAALVADGLARVEAGRIELPPAGPPVAARRDS